MLCTANFSISDIELESLSQGARTPPSRPLSYASLSSSSSLVRGGEVVAVFIAFPLVSSGNSALLPECRRSYFHGPNVVRPSIGICTLSGYGTSALDGATLTLPLVSGNQYPLFRTARPTNQFCRVCTLFNHSHTLSRLYISLIF